MNTNEVRRDRWGRYLVLAPDGPKPEGYTRATTIAKALDDTSSLMAWGERMTAIGMAQRPDLLAQVLDVVDDKKALGALCDRAKEAGGATVRRDLGTALHSILERAFTEPNYTPPPAHVADVAAVRQLLEAHGYRAVAGMHEQIVVCDAIKVAGTFDLLLEKDGRTFVADIKTGSSVTYGALGFAVQLAIYAGADAIYRQGAAKDGSEDQRLPMPEVDQAEAIIIHVEPGSGQATLHLLHLDRSLLTLALAVRKARTEKGRIERMELATLDDSGLRLEVAQWVVLDREALATYWPTEVPTPRNQAEPYTQQQKTAIEEALRELRTATNSPWHPGDLSVQPKPTETPPGDLQDHTPPTKMPAEGPAATKQAGEVQRRYNQLNRTQQEWIDAITRDAHLAHLSLSLTATPSTRRVAIAQTLVHAAFHHWGETHLHSVYDTTIDNTLSGLDMPLGHKLGALDYIQAKRLASLVTAAIEVTTTTPNTGATNNG